MKGGVATFTDLYDKLAETITLGFSGGGLTAGPTAPILVSPAAASKLVIQEQPSQTETAGVPFESTPIVREEDAYGNLIAGDNSTTVTATLASGTGTLSGATSVTMSGGVAAFPTLAEDTAGTFTLGFAGNGLNSLASVAFVVSPAAAAKLVLQTPPSPTATAGQALLVQPVVHEEDPFGNLITGDDITVVTAKLSSTGGRLVGSGSVDVNGGVATFSGLGDKTAEATTLVFSAPGLTSVTTGTITVSTAAASQWVIATPPSNDGDGRPGVAGRNRSSTRKTRTAT